MDKAIDVHDHVIRTQLGRFNGYEVTTEGDAFLMAFHEASDAIAWTLATQQVSNPLLCCGWYTHTSAMTATVTAMQPAMLVVAGDMSTAENHKRTIKPSICPLW